MATVFIRQPDNGLFMAFSESSLSIMSVDLTVEDCADWYKTYASWGEDSKEKFLEYLRSEPRVSWAEAMANWWMGAEYGGSDEKLSIEDDPEIPIEEAIEKIDQIEAEEHRIYQLRVKYYEALKHPESWKSAMDRVRNEEGRQEMVEYLEQLRATDEAEGRFRNPSWKKDLAGLTI